MPLMEQVYGCAVFWDNATLPIRPFLMLDGFDSTDPRDYIRDFPGTPHRGIETITYLIKEG